MREQPLAFDVAANPAYTYQQFLQTVKGQLLLIHEGQNLIYPAVRSAQLERVRWLVDQGLDPNAEDSNGYSPLLLACCDHRPQLDQIVDLLISMNVNPNPISSHGEHPLGVSIRVGRYDRVERLIDAGADPKLLDFSPLHQAAMRGDTDSIDLLASSGNLEERDRWQRTPWLTAMIANQVEAAARLRALGANTNVVGHASQHPLALCAQANACQSLLALLELGSDAQAPTGFGSSTALHDASEHGAVDAGRVLLKAGAYLEVEDECGIRPINVAASLPMIELLHAHGADLNHVDGTGCWPLRHATERHDYESVKWLLAHGAKVDRTSTGETALHTAIRFDNLQIAALLVNSGAALNQPDADGCSPLFYCKNVDAAKWLLRHGARLDVRDDIGQIAAQASYVKRDVRDYLGSL